MQLQQIHRRTFIRDSMRMAATATLFSPGASLTRRAFSADHPLQSIRLGGPSFAKTDDPEELALAHRKLGYRAAYCPGVALKDTDRIRALSEAFAKHDVVIAEVGRWCNLLDADPEKRRQNLADGDRGAGPGRGHRRAVLRGYCRLVQHDLLVRPAPGQPLAEGL